MSLVLTFPFRGLHKGALPGNQPKDTTSRCQNCRPYWHGRLRGGQRPGLVKWSATQIGSAEQPVVAMTVVNVVESE